MKIKETLREMTEVLHDLAEPPIFYGKDPEEWLRRIERYLNLNRTPTNHRFSVVQQCLEVYGKHWFNFISEIYPCLTWSEFKEFFMERFGSSEIPVNNEVEIFMVEVMGSGSDFKDEEDDDGMKKSVVDVDSDSSIFLSFDNHQEEVSRDILLIQPAEQLTQQREDDKKLFSPAAMSSHRQEGEGRDRVIGEILEIDEESGWSNKGTDEFLTEAMKDLRPSANDLYVQQRVEAEIPVKVTIFSKIVSRCTVATIPADLGYERRTNKKNIWDPFYVDTGQDIRPIRIGQDFKPIRIMVKFPCEPNCSGHIFCSKKRREFYACWDGISVIDRTVVVRVEICDFLVDRQKQGMIQQGDDCKDWARTNLMEELQGTNFLPQTSIFSITWSKLVELKETKGMRFPMGDNAQDNENLNNYPQLGIKIGNQVELLIGEFIGIETLLGNFILVPFCKLKIYYSDTGQIRLRCGFYVLSKQLCNPLLICSKAKSNGMNKETCVLQWKSRCLCS